MPGIPAAVDQLVLAATSRDPARRPADAGEFSRAVRRVRASRPPQACTEPSGLTGVMGAGVQGLAEAPWLDLDTPAATNGWWARNGTLPPAGGHDTGLSGTGPLPVSQAVTDPRGPAGTSQFGMGQFRGGGREDSHTLVVDREDGTDPGRRAAASPS